MEIKKITVSDAELRKGAEEGMDAFLKVFTDKYIEVTGGEINAETMPLLNGFQHSLLGYHIFREEVLEGGFVQLIQNGYGPYIFENPFAKAMRMFGAKDLAKLIYDAKAIYDANKVDSMQTRLICRKSVLMMSLWLCMNSMRSSTIWKNSSWIWKRW